MFVSRVLRHAHNMNEGIVQVEPKAVGKSKMISTAQVTGIARTQASELFEDAKRKTGSKMIAYENVAKAVGVSPGWFRKFVKGYEAKEPKASVYENILANYEAFCKRVETENTIDEQRLYSLRRGRLNARTESVDEEISS